MVDPLPVVALEHEAAFVDGLRSCAANVNEVFWIRKVLNNLRKDWKREHDTRRRISSSKGLFLRLIWDVQEDLERSTVYKSSIDNLLEPPLQRSAGVLQLTPPKH
mmetsp:Transcript_17513/g.28018  ORF Transcript_17513/g.28018 Transcript_17513/m.28018 type:complete len:105 (+) Transcript_17513:525-839(+)